MNYRRILVPLDGSPVSARGLREAVAIAKGSRARLCLMHVVEEYLAFATPDAAIAIGPMLNAMRAAGRRTLARAERQARAAGAKPDTRLEENASGRVADAIVAQARRWRADLIVMGTHGRRGVGRALLGSDAEVVARYSPVPVLLVPARGGRRASKT